MKVDFQRLKSPARQLEFPNAALAGSLRPRRMSPRALTACLQPLSLQLRLEAQPDSAKMRCHCLFDVPGRIRVLRGIDGFRPLTQRLVASLSCPRKNETSILKDIKPDSWTMT